MKKINKNNLKLQMINSAGNHVFEITSSRKEEIKPMKKREELMLNYGQKRIRNQSPTKGGKKCWYRIFEMLTHFVNLMKYFLIFDRRYLRREENCNSPTTCCSTN